MNRKELVKKLELLKPALSEELSAIFGCYMFQKHSITTWNGSNLSITADFEWDGESFAVNGKTLLGLLQNSNSEEIELAFNETEVEINAGKHQFTLPVLYKKAFIMPEVELGRSDHLTINEGFLHHLKIVRSTSATDHTLPALMGICFDLENGRIYSSEGDVITRAECESRKHGGKHTAANSFWDAALKLSDELGDGTLEFHQDWAVAKFTGCTVFGRTINSTVDFAKLIDKTLKGKTIEYTDLPDGFGEALARARVLTDAESKPTYLQVEDGTLYISAEGSYGQLGDELPFKGHPNTESIGVHAQLLERALKFCDRMAIRPNCTVYSNGTTIFHLIGNAK